LLGLDKIGILGQSVEKFFLEKKKLQKIEQEVLQNKPAKAEEMVLLTKEKKVPVNLYIRSRKDREGNIIGYFIGIYDITAFKSLQETLEEQVKERTGELREKVEELEQFQRIAVGRELKMLELKRELHQTQEEIKRLKGRQ
jgi:hypothetical protein